MARLEIIDSGILYINPDPAHYHVFASHAHPLQLSAQEFVATYQRGDGMYAVNGNIALTRSLDGGVTWQHQGFLHDKTAFYRAWRMVRWSCWPFAQIVPSPTNRCSAPAVA